MSEHGSADAPTPSVAQPRDHPPSTDPVSDAALTRYAARMRRPRLIYAGVLVVIAAIVLVLVKIAYGHGEISHATLRTVAEAPASVALRAPSPSLRAVWSSNDTTAVGTPSWNGTVVTHDAHTVRGVDALTGRTTWSYTRTDRPVCTAMQDGGLTVAVFELHGNCDEVTALDSGTGARQWTRTLDKDTAEFDGPATFAVNAGIFFFVSATSIYAISHNGVDYWTFHHVGCTIGSAVLGHAGALISQTCTGEPCNGAKFCGDGHQLLLRDATLGYDDSDASTKNNPDRIIWNKIGSTLVPVDAANSVAARQPGSGTLAVLDPKTGAQKGSVAISTAAGSPAVSSTTDADLIWIAGRTYALRADATAFAWQAATASVPVVRDTDNGLTPDLSVAQLNVPTPSGIAVLAGRTGKVERRFAVATPSPGSTVVPFGSGFVVAGPHTAVYR